jgi:hypothetical protein
MTSSVTTLRATDDDSPTPPLLPGLIGGILAKGAAMVRAIVVRSPVAPPHGEGDSPSPPAVHEIAAFGRIRLRGPTALLRWQRRPVAPNLPERGTGERLKAGPAITRKA